MFRLARYLPAEVLEASSSEVLEHHARRYGALGQFPVPVEAIAERTLDLSISWDALPARTGLILGALRPAGRAVILNELALDYFREFPGSEVFTLAHEIGHWVLHIDATLIDQPRLLPDEEHRDAPICTRADGGRLPPHEWQANAFAAQLLMPEPLVRAVIHGVTDFRSWPFLYQLAKDMGVSISALRIRLEQLGLLHVTGDGHLFPSAASAEGQPELDLP